MMRDLAQLYAARGEHHRGLRLLRLCLTVAERNNYVGQARQARGLIAAMRGRTSPRLESFRLH